MSQHYRNMVSAVLCAMLITTGTVVPFIQPATAQSDTPSPAIEDVDIPDEVTVGESFEVDVEGENNGGRAGAYSTITISSPDLDRPGDDSQIEITDDFDHTYSVKNGEGDQLYDADGDSMSAEYAMAEAGTTVDDYWEAGTSRSFAAEITPEESGTLNIYVRVTLTDDDSSEKYTAPSFGEEDQQDYTVEHYEVEVKEEAEIDATIEDVDPPSGEFTTGEEVTSEVTVENTGNRDHEFYVGYSVRGPDDEWRDNDASTHEPIYLGPGDDGEVDVEWDVEDDAPTGEYDIWATVYKDEDDGYLEDRLAETQRTDVFEVTTENSAPSIDTEDPYSDPTIAPGEEVEFEIEADDQDGNLNGVDWIVDGDYTGDSDQLSGNSDSAAWEHSFDSPGTYTVEAQAHDTQEEYSNRVSWTVTVEEPEQIDAEIVGIDEPGGEYTTGETVETGVTIENTGNTGHEFYVGYSVRGPDDEWRDNDASTHEPIYLGPGDDGEVDVEWEYEDDAPTGEYDIWLTVYKTEDDGYLENQLAETQRTDVFEVTIDNSPPTIEAEDPYSDPTIAPGEEVEFEIEADDQDGNLNGVDWIVDGDYTGDSDQLSGNSDSAAWEHSFDSPGTYTVEAQAHDTQEEYSNRVSWTVTVEEPEQIDADIVSVATPTGEYNVGDTVEATVTVENTGNTDHEFYVGYSVRGSDGVWRDNAATTHESATVDAGDQTTVDVEWEVEETAPIGTYDIWTTVYRDINNGKLENKLSGRQHFDVFEVAAENTPPTIEAEEPNTDITIKSEEALTFTTEVEDSNDNLAGVEWYVDGEYTGDTSQLEGDSGTATWEHTFDEAGTYTVAAEAFDQAEAYSETITWSVTVSEIDATIQSVDPPSAELTSSEVAETEITIENTGDTHHEFYVGYSVRGPDGEWRDNDESTHESVLINPSETATVDVKWDAEKSAPTGNYDIWVTVYEQETNGQLEDQLSEQQRSNVFEIKPNNNPPDIEVLEPTSNRTILLGDSVEFEVRAEDSDGDLEGINWSVEDEKVDQTTGISSSSDTADWEYTFDTEGTFTVEAEAYDEEASSSDSILWTVAVRNQSRGDIKSVSLPQNYSPRTTYQSDIEIKNPTDTTQEFELSAFAGSGVEFPEGAETKISIQSEGNKKITLPVRFTDTTETQSVTFELSTTEGDLVDETTRELSAASTKLKIRAVNENGERISDVPVDPYLPDLEKRSTNSDGEVSYSGIPEGDVIIFLENALEQGYSTKKDIPTYRSTVNKGEETMIIAEFERTVKIDGTVKKADGSPLSNVEVRIPSENIQVFTGSDGRFTIRGAEPETNYDLEVWDGSDRLSQIQRIFSPGEESVSIEIEETELRSDAGIRDQLLNAIPEYIDTGSNTHKSEIYDDNTAIIRDTPPGTGAEYEAGPDYFMTEDGTAYHTSGPCAWHNSRDNCETHLQSMAVGIAGHHGMVEGFSTGAEETIQGFQELAKPIQYVNSIITLTLTILGDIGITEELIAQIPQQIQEQQQADNPYNPENHPRLHQSFRDNWYGGYFTFLTVSGYVGGVGGKAVKSSSSLSKITDKIDDLPGDEVRNNIKFVSAIDGGDIKKAASEIKLPRGIDNSAWRNQIKEFADKSAVPDSLLERYLKSINSARQIEKVNNAENLYGKIIDNDKNKLVGTVLESERAVYWGIRTDIDRVEVEPGNSGPQDSSYDLKIDHTDGSTEYVEVKNTADTLSAKKIRNKIAKDGKIQDQIAKRSIPDDADAVATIGAESIDESIASREAIFREVRDGLKNSDKPIQFDELRVVIGEGSEPKTTYTFERSEFVIADSNVNSITNPEASPTLESLTYTQIPQSRSQVNSRRVAG